MGMYDMRGIEGILISPHIPRGNEGLNVEFLFAEVAAVGQTNDGTRITTESLGLCLLLFLFAV